MDLSFSMRDDLDNLKALGASLGEGERGRRGGIPAKYTGFPGVMVYFIPPNFYPGG